MDGGPVTEVNGDNIAAMAGWAQNPRAPIDQRLACSAQALDYYVVQAEKLDDLLVELVKKACQDNGYYERQFEAPAYRAAATQLAAALGVEVSFEHDDDCDSH